MEFSELFKHSNSQCKWSPNSRYLASTDKFRLFVRAAESLEIIHIFTNLDHVSRIEWSPDSQFVLCAQNKRRIVQVWDVRNPKWVCKIDEGIAGLNFARWSPDSRHILTSTDFELRLSIWSLVTRSCSYIKFPKFSKDGRGVAFSHDGKHLAVCERRQYRDVVCVYNTGSWAIAKRFEVDTEDLHGLKWSPDDRFLAIYDTPLEYRLFVYSPDGRLLSRFEAYEHGLGVRALEWSPSGSFLAAGSFDQCARIFNNVTWKAIGEFSHKASVSDERSVVYKEVPLSDPDPDDPADSDDHDSDNQSSVRSIDNVDASPSGDASQNAFRNKLASIKRKRDAKHNSIHAPFTGSLGLGSLSPPTPPPSPPPPTKSATSAAKMYQIKRKTSRSRGLSLPRTITAAQLRSAVIRGPSRFSVVQAPVSLPELKPSVDKPNPRIGVGMLAWSQGDRFLAVRNDNTPTALYVWNINKMMIGSVMLQATPVRQFKWDPSGVTERLLVCANSDKLYMWTPMGASVVDIPNDGFSVRSAVWRPDGRAVVLLDQRTFCVCYMDPADDDDDDHGDDDDDHDDGDNNNNVNDDDGVDDDEKKKKNGKGDVHRTSE